MSEILDKLEYTVNTMIIFCVYYQPRVSKNIRCQSLIATATINTTTNQVDKIIVTNAGFGYTVAPVITVGASSTIGSGTFVYGDIITGESTLSTAFVTKWDTTTNTLLAKDLSGDFAVGEQITNVGFGTAVYTLDSIDYDDDDAFNTGDSIQTLTQSSIVDFTERNPFGEV